jgi:cytochrome P450
VTDLFTNPHRYGDLEAWRREAVALHARGPIHRIDQPGYQPFWAVIGHAAVLDVERRPEEFTNAPIPILGSDEQLSIRAREGAGIRTLIHMDEPDHAKYRKLTNDWFKPASIRRLSDRLDELSRRAVARLEELGGEADFYKDVALAYPLQVILSILGLPEADYPRMIKLTQELFGAEDPDLKRDVVSSEEMVQVITDFYQYFSALTADRQGRPTDDLATLIANGTIDDAPMPDLEKMGYYVIIATAGHDTTAAAMAGGLRALAEHPDQLRILQNHPELLSNAVERDDPVDGTGAALHAHRAGRDRDSRRQDREGRLALPVVPCRQPRPRGLRESVALRRHTSKRRQARRVRLRDPLLPRRPTRTPRAPLAVRRTGAAAPIP